MQYWQRKLQRSVTETRRSPSSRPWASCSAMSRGYPGKRLRHTCVMKRTQPEGVSEFTPSIGGFNSDTSAVGVVLAGGRGSRLRGGKAAVELAGRPLISYPLAAIEAAGLEVVICTKPGEPPPPSRGSFVRPGRTKEPRLEPRVLEEPAQPRHPLTGIVAA